MKATILLCVACVIFSCLTPCVGHVFALNTATIEFEYDNRIFSYHMEEAISTSAQFDILQKTKQHKRFGSHKERTKLLTHMINIGFDKDVSLNYIFPNLNKTISNIEKAINTNPKNAVLKINEKNNQVFIITPEQVGISVNKLKLYDEIFNSFTNGKKLLFKIPTTTTAPQIKKEDLEKFTNLRGDFSTNISTSSSDRKHNIKTALKSLNKIEIVPNEVFSFNKTVGKRTAENGYRQAKIIINNEFVDGIGGGVCQVSSTLYNTALLAGLEIVEANKHSKPISYVKTGFDAMVNFGSSDLKFKNNTNEKLTIITNYSNSSIRIRIFGEDLKDVKYSLSNEIFNQTEPKEEILTDINNEHIDKITYNDEFFILKKPMPGFEVKTYREKLINGTPVSKEILRHDKYSTQNGVKIYGNKKREPLIQGSLLT